MDRAALDGLPFPPEQRRLIARWLEDPAYEDTWAELETLVAHAAAGDGAALDELADAFAGPLPIGTGGRRGPCGPGPNRMNAAVLRETAAGLAGAMRAFSVTPRAAVAYDTRASSRAFTRVVAEELARHGVEVRVLDAPRPTPQLSFELRRTGCGAGAVISASHNPPRDNGIKVYGPDGAQVLGAWAEEVTRRIEAAARGEGPTPAQVPGAVTYVHDGALAEADRAYHEVVLAQGCTEGDLAASGLSVVYTPLHGVGASSVLPALARRGLAPATVAAQMDPDGGRFSTVASANPEDPAAFALARQLAEEVRADLVLATDPDADRLGALARGRDGALSFIDGNRLGVLMLDHVLRHGPDRTGWVLTTLVTTPLVGKLCRAAGVEVVEDLLVGFKHHAGLVREHPDRPVVFACEESHGYLRGNDVREKDGAIAALLLAEAAAEAKARGATLVERLEDVWRRHGYHRERTWNLREAGPRGRRAMAAVMEAVRRSPPERFGPLRPSRVTDRKEGLRTGSPTRDLPGNVVVFDGAVEGGGLAGARLVFRPSGTEPKLKLYVLGWTDPGSAADAGARVAADRVVESIGEAAEDWTKDVLRSAGGA